MQRACERCHAAELKASNDAHPQRKFTDPRNADRVAELDARYCVTCHREHRAEVTSAMGLSLPRDYCVRCHSSIGEERPSHLGMSFESCAEAGCHNFHDNRALYEDFLARHLDDAKHASVPKNPARKSQTALARLARSDADAPESARLSPSELKRWEESAHARARVNCSGCHGSPKDQSWSDSVGPDRCGTCHEGEEQGFLESRHGMKRAAGLGAMHVGSARLPMRDDASDRSVTCLSCHGAHGFDTRHAAMVACSGCHADRHTQEYRKSRHAELWLADVSGSSGASCATCHLPRLVERAKVRVHHNQNDTLRPNEKMARAVCLNCHGLGFALDALADVSLIQANFQGQPKASVRSLAMVRQRLTREGAPTPSTSLGEPE